MEIQSGKITAIAVGPITVDKVEKNSLTGEFQAQIRQIFKKAYPSKKTSNEFKDSLFSNEELNIEETDYDEQRVTWIPTAKGIKVKDVEAKLATVPTSTIYKVLSDSPIISSDLRSVLESGLTGEKFENFCEQNGLEKDSWDAECSEILLNKVAERQVVRYGEDNDANKPADEVVLFNGQKQYREVYFSLTARPDMDMRKTNTKQDMPAFVLATEEVEETVAK